MTIVIRNPQDVDNVVRMALHFAPEDSFVVVPVSGGNAPVARVDLGPSDILRETFADVLDRWTNVLVAIYGDAPDLDVESILPGVNVLAVVNLPNPDGDAFRRANLASLVAHIATAEDAEAAAWDAYKGGDGALAWECLDRAKDLAGSLTMRGTTLAAMLAKAVNPYGD